MLNFKKFLLEWELTPEEVLREIRQIVNQYVNFSNGISEINIQSISTKQLPRGKQIVAEIEGITKAKDENHVKRQLNNFVSETKAEMNKKGIYFKINANPMNISEIDREFNFKAFCTIFFIQDSNQQTS